MGTGTSRGTLAFRLTLVLIGYLLLEAGAWTGLRVLRATRGIDYDPLILDSLPSRQREIIDRLVGEKTRYQVFSADLGWTIKPGGEQPPLYRASAQGIRADREYAPVPHDDTLRVAAFGDSFTHGDGVANGDTWESRLESLLPGTEVLNFGVGGFGLDQAFLRYRHDGAKYQPAVVLIGMMSENIRRHVNAYRPFYTPQTGQPLSKPRFLLRGDTLELVPNPIRTREELSQLLDDPGPLLRRLGATDWYYGQRYRASPFDVSPLVRLAKIALRIVRREREPVADGEYQVESEAYRVTVALIDRFAAEVRESGARPLVLLFPDREDIRRLGQDRPPAYQPLLADLDAKNQRYLDLRTAFDVCRAACDLDGLVPGHYSVAGNQLVARRIAEWFKEIGVKR